MTSRWARRLAWLWFAAAGVWALADVILLVADGRLAGDVAVVPVLVLAGIATGRASLTIDDEGFEVREGLRSYRVLWAAVERIEVHRTRRSTAPVRVHLRREDHPLELAATWGLPPGELDALLAALRPPAEHHAIPLTER